MVKSIDDASVGEHFAGSFNGFAMIAKDDGRPVS
jgi:hypothetical protein